MSEKPKSGNGAGSITARTDGRWEVRVTDPATGKRVSRYAKTEAAANRLLRSMLGRADTGAPVADGRATLRAYGDRWLTERAPRRRSAATVREYRRRFDAYLVPTLGGLRLSEVTSLDVEDVLDGLAARGLSQSTIRGTRNTLAAMLSDAVRARHLVVNVAAAARLPEVDVERPRVDAPTAEEVLALLDAAQGTAVEHLVVILATTGARVGEALGATWSDVDLDRGAWRITRTVTLDLDGRPVLGARGKTAASTRTVALPPLAVAALRAQRARVAELALAAGPLWVGEHDLVFPSERGTVWDVRNARKRFAPVAAAAGFPGSFHALRHAFASAAVAVLPSDAAVAKVLGHAKRATTTDLYAHLRAESSSAVAGAVVASLDAARERRHTPLASG